MFRGRSPVSEHARRRVQARRPYSRYCDHFGLRCRGNTTIGLSSVRSRIVLDGVSRMVKPNYAFAKRQRELAKKQNKDAKRQRKAETDKAKPAAPDETQPATEPSAS